MEGEKKERSSMTTICPYCDNIVLKHVLVPLAWYFLALGFWYVQAEGREELIVINHDINQKGSTVLGGSSLPTALSSGHG